MKVNSSSVGLNNKQSRDIWLEAALQKIPAGMRILDAGASQLQYKKFCAHLNYVSQDFGQYDGKGDGAGLQTQTWDQSQLDIICDITAIPERDGSFDAVMCIEVLEHLPDPIGALKELVRLLHPGGMLVVTAPFNCLTHFAPYFYYSGYSRYFYEHWLKEFGLQILDMKPNGNFFEYMAQELRRLPSISNRYAADHLTWLEKKALRVLLNALARFSAKDKGSDEFLCFGYHVLAKKV